MSSFRGTKFSRVVNWNSPCRAGKEYTLAWALITVNLGARAGWALASWYSLCNEVLRRLGFADYVYRIRISLEAPFNNSSSTRMPPTASWMRYTAWLRNRIAKILDNKLLNKLIFVHSLLVIESNRLRATAAWKIRIL